MLLALPLVLVLVYLKSQCTKCHAAGWKCWFLHHFIWSHESWCNFATEQTKEQFQILHKSRKKSDEDPGHDQTSVRGREDALLRADWKRQDRWRVKSILIIFLDIKGIVHKDFVLAGQTVNPAYCCDVSRWLHEKVPRCYTISGSLFTRHFFSINNMIVVPPPPKFYFSVSSIEDKTEKTPFCHNWGDQGRNTLTEHNF
jgi:hypothetical protein